MEHIHDIRSRYALVSGFLLGKPYRRRPLGGGPNRPERIIVNLRGFDCVTFIEVVTALSLSSNPSDYRDRILQLRYGGRRPSWEHRLHYMSEWLTRNSHQGILEHVPPGGLGVSTRKELALVPGIPPQSVALRLHPWALTERVCSAHIAAFVPHREDLDVFHVGVVVDTVLRHAALSSGEVVEEPLEEFMARQSGRGLLLARIRQEEQ